MRHFIGTALAIAAALFGMMGAVAILAASLVLSDRDSAWYYCLMLLVPVWGAAAMLALDWSIEYRRTLPCA